MAWWMPRTPDGGVGQVDDEVAGLVEAGQGGAGGDGLADADFAGDHAEGFLGHAPGDAGDGFAVGGVAVQHAGCEAAAERHPGESVEALQFADAHSSSWPLGREGLVDGHLAGELARRQGRGGVVGAAEQGGVVDPLVQLAAVRGVDQVQVVDPC